MTRDAIALIEPTATEVEAAYLFWTVEREGWPLGRALPIWLAFNGAGGAGYEWDVEADGQGELFDRWFYAVLAHAGIVRAAAEAAT